MAEVDVGESIHLSELKLPPNVTSVALAHGEDYDAAVVTVLSPRGGGVMDEEAEEAAEEAAPSAVPPETSADEADEDEAGGDEAGDASEEDESRG